jgi:hypothetical protein
MIAADDSRKDEIMTPEAELAERLYNMLETRNITTPALVNLIREVDPMMQWTPGPRWSKRKVVGSFIASAPPHVVGMVIRKVTGDEDGSDPYLTGLLNRAKRS